MKLTLLLGCARYLSCLADVLFGLVYGPLVTWRLVSINHLLEYCISGKLLCCNVLSCACGSTVHHTHNDLRARSRSSLGEPKRNKIGSLTGHTLLIDERIRSGGVDLDFKSYASKRGRGRFGAIGTSAVAMEGCTNRRNEGIESYKLL